VRTVSPAMQALLGPTGARQLVVCDLYTFNLVDGTNMYFTSFDRDVSYNGVTYSSGTRIALGRPGMPKIAWQRGVNVDRLTITIAPQSSDPGDLFLTLAQALVAGRFDGCRVTLARAFNPILAPGGAVAEVDPNLGAVTLFVGLVSEVTIDRAVARLSVANISELLNIQFPRHHMTTQCRWTLFDAGCTNNKTATNASMTAGSAVLTASFSGGGLDAQTDVGRTLTVYGAGILGGVLIGTIVSVESATEATLSENAATTVNQAQAVIGLVASNVAVSGVCGAGCTVNQIISDSLTQQPGYFDLGRIVFTSGQNKGITRSIQRYLAPASSGPTDNGLLAAAQRYTPHSSYLEAVMADKPLAYWRLGQNGNDYSGNGYNLTVNGGVSFGNPGALVGDPMTSAYFDGATGYAISDIPDPQTFPGTEAAITIEFWVKTPQTQAQGLFDTNPAGDLLPGGYRQAPGTNALRGFNYGYGGFEWNPAAPALAFGYPANAWTHVVVIFFGNQAINVYANGRLAAAASAAGAGYYEWTGFQIGYNLFNYIPPSSYNWGIAGSGTPGAAPSQGGFYKVWFEGYLQEYALYNYALSFQQIATHYGVGSNGPNTSGAGVLNLWQALPYAPAQGDEFTVYPGCDKSVFACRNKFNNFLNYGGFPFIPNEETAL
jgi:hypothetical protein